MGRVDVLVNCVGIAGPHALLEDISDEDWQTSMQVNVTGMFYTMKRAIPGMKERRYGAIVNFSTGSTITRLPSRSAYIVSKYAVEGLTMNAARELGPFNVRCNAILPGAINNDRMNMVMERGAKEAGYYIGGIRKRISALCFHAHQDRTLGVGGRRLLSRHRSRRPMSPGCCCR